MTNGSGFSQLVPSIRDSEYFTSRSEELPCLIRNGIKAEFEMPGHTDISAVDIVNIINFVRRDWHNNSATTSLTEVNNQLNDCN